MELKRKYMSRSSWERIIDREYITINIKEKDIKGKAGLLYIKDLKEPLTKIYNKKIITIANKNYYWLQIGIENKNYWITAMYDNNEKLIQYYIDITKRNYINDGDSYFEDLFLDVVIFPTKEKIYLDGDELDKAFNEKIIKKEEYDLAIYTANYISDMILNNKEEFDNFCYKYFNSCKENLKIIN